MDMNKLMQQAQQMQENMQKLQEELKDKQVEAESGGGAVKVVFNGRQELVSLKIDPTSVDPDEVDLLEDLILAAMQEGQRKASDMAQEEMKRVAGPLGGGGIPGLF
ncbi:MAG TPA: YbaB/EbfC family nucleoid-associated protein [Candidatus Krumholzibacteria bacterium]|nr:YbaB/EbfC family nucleoid-associated protein [Candidatus Krumholzibacteria bacterium]